MFAITDPAPLMSILAYSAASMPNSSPKAREAVELKIKAIKAVNKRIANGIVDDLLIHAVSNLWILEVSYDSLNFGSIVVPTRPSAFLV